MNESWLKVNNCQQVLSATWAELGFRTDEWISKHHIYKDGLNIMYVYAWMPGGQMEAKLEWGMICTAEWMDRLQSELTFCSASSSSLLIFRSSSNILRREKNRISVIAAVASCLLVLGLIWQVVIANSLWWTFLANELITQLKLRWFMLGNEEVDSGWSTSLLNIDQMFSF